MLRLAAAISLPNKNWLTTTTTNIDFIPNLLVLHVVIVGRTITFSKSWYWLRNHPYNIRVKHVNFFRLKIMLLWVNWLGHRYRQWETPLNCSLNQCHQLAHHLFAYTLILILAPSVGVVFTNAPKWWGDCQCSWIPNLFGPNFATTWKNLKRSRRSPDSIIHSLFATAFRLLPIPYKYSHMIFAVCFDFDRYCQIFCITFVFVQSACASICRYTIWWKCGNGKAFYAVLMM